MSVFGMKAMNIRTMFFRNGMKEIILQSMVVPILLLNNI